MINKELVIQKLEILEGNLKALAFFAQQGADIQAYNDMLEKSNNLVDDLKSLVERQN